MTGAVVAEAGSACVHYIPLSGQWVSRAASWYSPFNTTQWHYIYARIYVPRWNLYKSMRGRCADCASRFISFFRIYTQRIEWKENIIPPARREKERSIYLQIFLLFAFPRAPSNKKQGECIRAFAGELVWKREQEQLTPKWLGSLWRISPFLQHPLKYFQNPLICMESKRDIIHQPQPSGHYQIFQQ